MAKKTEETMEFEFRPVDTRELAESCERKMNDFSKLVDSLSSGHDKKKALWKQIYENAVTDRRNAYIMFNNLYLDVHGNPDQHALHGQNLTKYLERMSKSNEQLIRLAEILDEVIDVENEELMDEQDMYEKLQSMQKGRQK